LNKCRMKERRLKMLLRLYFVTLLLPVMTNGFVSPRVSAGLKTISKTVLFFNLDDSLSEEEKKMLSDAQKRAEVVAKTTPVKNKDILDTVTTPPPLIQQVEEEAAAVEAAKEAAYQEYKNTVRANRELDAPHPQVDEPCSLVIIRSRGYNLRRVAFRTSKVIPELSMKRALHAVKYAKKHGKAMLGVYSTMSAQKYQEELLTGKPPVYVQFGV